MTDHSAMKLGRIRAEADPRVPHLMQIWNPPGMPPSLSMDWYSRVKSFPMLRNDSVGDCTCAAVSHVIQQWTTYTDFEPVVMDDARTIALYSAVSGYVPGNPATDGGAICADVLRYWMVTGIDTPDGGPDMLSGFARINPIDTDSLRHAVGTFGNLYAGIALPTSAQTEDIWTATDDVPGSWGGHCVPLVGYNAAGPICVTWGALKQMTWDWWAAYAEEAYALLSRDWLRATGTDPAGVDWGALGAAMDVMRRA